MNPTERRKHPRIETDVTVEVYTSDSQIAEPEVAEICNVVNLSESGMRFTAARRFDTKQLLRLTFLLPDSIIIIRTDAKVVYFRKGTGNLFDIGVKFANANPAERKLIRHFVNKILKLQNTAE